MLPLATAKLGKARAAACRRSSATCCTGTSARCSGRACSRRLSRRVHGSARPRRGGRHERARARSLALAAAVAAVALLAGCERRANNGTTYQGYVEGEFVYLSSSQSGTLTQLSVARGPRRRHAGLLARSRQRNGRAAAGAAPARGRPRAARRPANGQAPAGNRGHAGAARAVHRAGRAGRRATRARRKPVRRRRPVETAARRFAHVRANDRRAEARTAETGRRRAPAGPRAAGRRAGRAGRRRAGGGRRGAMEARPEARRRTRRRARVRHAVPRRRMGAGRQPGRADAAAAKPEGALRAGGRDRLARAGRTVAIHCDGCAADVPARITYVSSEAEYTPPVIYSNESRTKLVFMIEARPAAGDAPKLHPGQPSP